MGDDLAGSHTPFDAAVALIVLGMWEALIGGLYWWCWRQMRQAAE